MLLRLTVLAILLCPAWSVEVANWPGQYAIKPWEAERLTAADVVGPDGIVYPDWTGVGVTGGIPDINAPAVRASYTVFDVTTFGANGSDDANDDQGAAAAVAAALAQAAIGTKSIVFFPAGTYHLTKPLLIDRSGVVIDGAGREATVLVLDADPAQKGSLVTFKASGTWTGPYVQSAATLPRGSAIATWNGDLVKSGYAVGQWIRIHATDAGPGTTMRTRYSKPDTAVVYTKPYYDFGRLFLARIMSLDAATRTTTFDRTFPHDFYLDEKPEMRRLDALSGIGLQDLTIRTSAATAPLDPVNFYGTTDSWMRNVRLTKPRNWPFLQTGMARCEVRDCVFDGTWAIINNGSTAYLGWTEAVDCLMEDCQGNDLRHMGIFQIASRCVVRTCSFSGGNVQSPQLHGRLPLDNLIEGTTYACTGPSGGTRALTAWGTDATMTLRHGPNGPRNVLYGNHFETGAGSLQLGGAQEATIFAYNRVRKTDEGEGWPAFWGRDRSFDILVRGNVIQSSPTAPAIVAEDPTTRGWTVIDNDFHGTNGTLVEGDGSVAVHHGNRFRPETAPLADPSPEVPSIYAWQREHARQPRLLIMADRHALDLGGDTTPLQVVRVHADTTAALSVTLTAPGLGLPARVTIPAGAVRVDVPLTVPAGLAPGRVTLTATAAGLLADTERVELRNLAADGGRERPLTTPVAGGWQQVDFGKTAKTGSTVVDPATGSLTISGAGLPTCSYSGTLANSGRTFVYQALDGDGTIQARLTAFTGKGQAQAGLMIADDLATITEFIMVEPNGHVLGSGKEISRSDPIDLAKAGSTTAPVWLRLQRRGSVFTAAVATADPPAERDWTVRVSLDFYQAEATADYKSASTLDARMYVGMLVNSGAAGTLATATFTGISISRP